MKTQKQLDKSKNKKMIFFSLRRMKTTES